MKIKKILNPKRFKKWLEKEIGKRCRDYCWDCFVCRSWKVYDEVEGYVWSIEALDRPMLFDKKRKAKRKK